MLSLISCKPAVNLTGNNRVIPLIVNEEWNKVLELLHSDKALAQQWSNSQSFTGDVMCNSKILPLHQACVKANVEIEFLEALIDVYPMSLQTCETGCMRTALHLAIMSCVNEKVISYLIDKYPAAVSIQDDLGRIPLHYACSNQSTLSIIQKLIGAFPDTIRATDSSLWTPLHTAAHNSHSLDIIDFMLKCCPEAIVMATRKGSTPAFCARENTTNMKNLILARLVEEEQEYRKTPLFKNFKTAEYKVFH